MTEPAEVYEEPRYTVRRLLAMPPIDPPISRDRACMTGPLTLPTRLARQIARRSVLRDCCEHHSIDWHEVSAIAVRHARRLNREHITDARALFDRVIDLTWDLSGDQARAVRSLLSPGDGIMICRLGEDPRHPRRWTYQNGRKRTHVMLETGVRRTVVVDWREIPPR
jgi:hypothetical protein